MSKFAAIKVTEEMETGVSYTVTKEMIDSAPHFETEAEASKYCDIISTDFLWVIMPLNEEP